jgi:glucokinase
VSFVVGLDVGGTKIAGGLVELPAGQILAQERIPTGAARGGRAVLADCVALAERLARSTPLCVPGRQLAAIGIGLPELVDPRGAVTSAASFDLRGTDVAAAFAHLAPATVEADVRAAAVAEARLGAGRRYRIVLYVSVGTGISHTLVVDGVPYRGARGNALVLGSPLVEEVAAGPAIARAAGRGSAEEALADPSCAGVVERAAAALGAALAALVNATDPEAVVIGGGLGLDAGYRASAERVLRDGVFAVATSALPVLPASLGADAGVIGAALSASERD